MRPPYQRERSPPISAPLEPHGPNPQSKPEGFTLYPLFLITQRTGKFSEGPLKSPGSTEMPNPLWSPKVQKSTGVSSLDLILLQPDLPPTGRGRSAHGRPRRVTGRSRSVLSKGRTSWSPRASEASPSRDFSRTPLPAARRERRETRPGADRTERGTR